MGSVLLTIRHETFYQQLTAKHRIVRGHCSATLTVYTTQLDTHLWTGSSEAHCQARNGAMLLDIHLTHSGLTLSWLERV